MTNDAIVAQIKTWIRNRAISSGEALVILQEIDGEDISTEDFAEHLEMYGYPNLAAEVTGAPVDEGWYFSEEELTASD